MRDIHRSPTSLMGAAFLSAAASLLAPSATAAIRPHVSAPPYFPPLEIAGHTEEKVGLRIACEARRVSITINSENKNKDGTIVFGLTTYGDHGKVLLVSVSPLEGPARYIASSTTAGEKGILKFLDQSHSFEFPTDGVTRAVQDEMNEAMLSIKNKCRLASSISMSSSPTPEAIDFYRQLIGGLLERMNQIIRGVNAFFKESHRTDVSATLQKVWENSPHPR
jgi:hypothetical protein